MKLKNIKVGDEVEFKKDFSVFTRGEKCKVVDMEPNSYTGDLSVLVGSKSTVGRWVNHKRLQPHNSTNKVTPSDKSSKLQSHPITMGDIWYHEIECVLYKVTLIWITVEGETRIHTTDINNKDKRCIDSIKSFINNYSFSHQAP